MQEAAKCCTTHVNFTLNSSGLLDTLFMSLDSILQSLLSLQHILLHGYKGLLGLQDKVEYNIKESLGSVRLTLVRVVSAILCSFLSGSTAIVTL